MKISNMVAGIYECSLHFASTDRADPFVEVNVFTITINGAKSEEIDVVIIVGENLIP